MAITESGIKESDIEESDIEESDIEELDIKEVNRKNYIKNSKNYKSGKRPCSPWWYLINKLEKRYINKDTEVDFSVTDFKPIKIKIKTGKGKGSVFRK